jgi:hypothetical protein
MSTLPPSSRYLQRATEPVGETEREALVKRVSDAFTDGRLNQESYQQSMDVIYGAKTLGDLVPVVEQLPAAAVNTPAIVGEGKLPAGQTGELYPPARAGLMAVGAIAGIAVLLVVVVALALWLL